MPEFVPFNDKDFDANVSPRKTSQGDKISTPSNSIRRRTPSRSPYRNERQSSACYSSERQLRTSRTENGDRRSPKRESRLSPRQEKRSTPRRNERNRSRSPRRSPHSSVNNSYNEAPPRREQYRRIEYHRSTERLSGERHRQGGASVFDRMSNPPARRRYNVSYNEERSVSRNSADSSSNGLTQLVRTVSNHYDQMEPTYRSTEQALDMELLPVSYQRSRSPIQEQIRYVEQFMVESNHIPDASSSRSVLLDGSLELGELGNRILNAQNHCNGLETTVLSYQREIRKLRQIVDLLLEDFKILCARLR